jgi:hypothetical protein
MKCEACGHINEKRKKVLPEAEFDAFWKAYPRKTGKFLANKVWKKITNEEGLFQRIILSVEKHKRSLDWIKDNGMYIPHASTWLNQQRWNDEVPENGKIVNPGAYQSPETKDKEKAAKDRLEAIREKEFQKRELVRLAQERDDARSRKMMEAAGEKDEESWEVKKSPAIPVEIRNCRDENGNKFDESLERSGWDGE